jgi:hypothetical protein
VDKSVDLEVVQRIKAKLARVLEEYPESQQALEDYLTELEQGGWKHERQGY